MIDSTHTTHPSALTPTPSDTTVPGTTVSGSGAHPYVAPAIIFRTPLEAVAASCYSAPGKADVLSCLVGNS
jgi:hypothetical protein